MLTRRNLRTKVLQSLYSYYQSDKENAREIQKHLFISVNKVYELAIWHLSFFIELVDFVNRKHEDAKNKFFPSANDLNPNTRFIDNEFIKLIINNRDLNNKIRAYKIFWTESNDMVRRIYQLICDSDLYKNFMKLENPSFKESVIFYKRVFNDIIAVDSGYKSFFEELYFSWATWEERKVISSPHPLSNEYFSDSDKEFLGKFLSSAEEDEITSIDIEESGNNEMSDYYMSLMVTNKLLSFIEKKHSVDFILPPLYVKEITGKDHQDIVFTNDLLLKTIENDKEFHEVISGRIQNWDVDRLTLIDIILIKMALTEFVDFPTIPVKATINEYIELSKIYGTSKSSSFVNGILDKVLNDFRTVGRINKLGRGLME